MAEYTEKQVAVVTGASRGIGRAVALELAAKGIFVIINYNGSADRAEKVKKEIEENGGCAEALQWNVADYKACEQAVRDIVKKYGNNVILDDISLQIKKGEIVSILGPSGSGKTTLLNLILGITDISSGKIIYDGEDITNVPLEKRGFNIVFQDYALFPNLTAYENIVYGLRNKPGISTEQDVQDFIHLLGLEEHLNKRISQLSGGQKQRVALARTMVMKPKILLLDEPLSALDGVIKESIKSKIKEIAREFSLTTIIVTHDPEEALTLSDKVLIINDGEIAQYGTPKEIIQQPADDFVENFILNQLEIKRTNIFHLFAECAATA